ncbi:hypothetical protein Cfor_00759 [Coptotermes formosanus]|uniref:Uncharacterized protein n=1 Tax=Coptotermes formosanus TaxID=36987 RepID=A0A6L2PEA4_COPFO|nr:hypothetical protein Cfor_00759 [Coptotermes formosanus]
MVPKLLTPEQKEIRMNICADILQNVENDPDFLENIVTYPESKCQSMHWKSPSSPRQKKARQSKSKFKEMMIVFFDIRGIVHMHWVPEGRTVSQVYYRGVLTNLHEWGRSRLSNWCSKPIGEVVCVAGGVVGRTHQRKGK